MDFRSPSEGIGYATLDADGALMVVLRAEDAQGTVAETFFTTTLAKAKARGLEFDREPGPGDTVLVTRIDRTKRTAPARRTQTAV